MEPLSSKAILFEDFPIYFFVSIDFVSYDRISYRSEMNSDLVCATREQIDLEKRISIIDYSLIAKLCFSDFWIYRIFCRHFFAIIGVTTDE